MRPTVVLLPGLDGTGQLFSSLKQSLLPQIATQVVAYPTDVTGYDETIALVLKSLPSQESYVLLGESFSGPVAVAVAGHRPRGLVGLILCASFLKCPSYSLRILSPLLNFLPSVRPPLPLVVPMLTGRFGGAAVRSEISAALDKVPVTTLKSRLLQVATVDVSSTARALELPVLYLRATADRLVPNAASDHARKCIKQLVVQNVDGPHFLLQTKPRESANAIQDFVAARCAA